VGSCSSSRRAMTGDKTLPSGTPGKGSGAVVNTVKSHGNHVHENCRGADGFPVSGNRTLHAWVLTSLGDHSRPVLAWRKRPTCGLCGLAQLAQNSLVDFACTCPLQISSLLITVLRVYMSPAYSLLNTRFMRFYRSCLPWGLYLYQIIESMY
jgi:hypothetical protein